MSSFSKFFKMLPLEKRKEQKTRKNFWQNSMICTIKCALSSVFPPVSPLVNNLEKKLLIELFSLISL